MLTPTDYASDSKTVSETTAPCPVVQALNMKASPAASGAPPAARLPSKPDIIFPGNGGARVNAVTIAEEGRVSPAELRLDVVNRRARLPDGAALQPNTRYQLRISLGGGTEPLSLSFVASGPGSLVILRIE
jgi:hypothetical protein